MDTKTIALLDITPDFLKKAGIELETGKAAAANARAAIIADNGGKGFVPQNADSDFAIQIMDYARRKLAEGENANKQVCIALASVDMSKAYGKAIGPNGKAYTSMLAFSMDVLPSLAKSTVAGLLAVGRYVYVPALESRFGDSSGVLLELPPSTLEALKANLSNEKTCTDTIDVLKEAAKDGKVTQKLAKGIAKVVRDRAAMDKKPDMDAGEMLKAAKQDTPAMEKLYGKSAAETTSKPSGATKNGGNAESAAHANAEEYNALKAKVLDYMIVSRNKKGANVIVIGDDEKRASFAGFLRKVMVSADGKSANMVCRAIAEILEK